MSGNKYIVVEREDINYVLVGKRTENYLRFDYKRQAEVWKAGLEAMNPTKAYCIVHEVPISYKQVSLFTGEKEPTYDYT